MDIDAGHYTGHENLELMSDSHRFNDWMYEEISSSLYGDILEIGSGIGTFSEKLTRDFPNSNLTFTDISSMYVELLKKKFSSNGSVVVYRLDLNERIDYERIGYKKFDSILAVNVLEHVENDEFAFTQLYDMLKEKGTLIVLVPCHKFLYNIIDKNIGHYRRYTKKELEYKVRKTGFVIDKTFYFNTVGMIGWYLNGNLFKKPKVSRTGVKILDSVVPVLKYTERIFGKRIGLSIICTVKKKK
jgi:SAM-dependent methyltransferase